MMSFMMGYVDAEYIDEFNTREWIGENRNELALYIDSAGNPGVNTNGKTTILDEEYRLIYVDVGDRFRLNFDFDSKECMAFYNEKPLGLLTTDLPQSIHLAASILYDRSSFETSLLDAMQ